MKAPNFTAVFMMQLYHPAGLYTSLASQLEGRIKVSGKGKGSREILSANELAEGNQTMWRDCMYWIQGKCSHNIHL